MKISALAGLLGTLLIHTSVSFGITAENVLTYFETTAFQEVSGYETKWKVEMTTFNQKESLDALADNIRAQKEAYERSATSNDKKQARALGIQEEAIRNTPLVLNKDVEVKLLMESMTRWKLTWWQKDMGFATRTEVISDGDGFVYEVNHNNHSISVTDSPWPQLGQYLRGVAPILVASKLKQSSSATLSGDKLKAILDGLVLDVNFEAKTMAIKNMAILRGGKEDECLNRIGVSDWLWELKHAENGTLVQKQKWGQMEKKAIRSGEHSFEYRIDPYYSLSIDTRLLKAEIRDTTSMQGRAIDIQALKRRLEEKK
jgi:hypothetical protein